MNKEGFIKHLQEQGKTLSWVELATVYGFSSGDVARLYWKRYKSKNKIKSFVEVAEVTRVKKWQLPNGEWRESIQYSSDDKSDSLSELKLLKEELYNSLSKLSITEDYKVDIPKINPVAYEISLPDFHFGKLTGETIKEQKKIFVDAVKSLYYKGDGLNIERIVLPIGNDLLNSEGLRMSTTKGTPQHDNTDWMITFKTAIEAVIESIEFLKEKAYVDVVMISGNHDYERCFYLGEVLSAYYSNSKIVSVDNSMESRKYYIYGKNLIGFTHGDQEKISELPLIMATERPVEFSKCPNREWHLGHIHKHLVDEFRGIAVKFLPSLCGGDEWHKKMGYHSIRRAQAYIWSKDNGCEGFIQYNK